MIVADNNALNSYLKIPPFFGTGREAPSVFEVAAPRRVPDALQERGTDRERESAERRFEEPSHPRQALVAQRRSLEREHYSRADYQRLTRLRVPEHDEGEIDPRLSQSTRIRAALARSGEIPEQIRIAGGHAFDAPMQAHATLIASRVRSGSSRPASNT
ncbi:MAG: hypothetical protein Kow006_16320 [Gammaproteobacteria bacterium]